MVYVQALVILTTAAIHLSTTLPQNGGNTIITEPIVNATPSICVTGKYIRGTCVKREICDFGTAAVDFSLYQPRAFKRWCSFGYVCCPPEYLVHQEERVGVPQNESFNFDNDD